MKAVLTALALCVPLAALAAPKAQELILENGLKVVVKEDRRAPIVTSQVWYRIGSSFEYGGITGVSHVLEHMMFKGTEKHAPGEFSRIVAESGGDENAFTGRDYTAYYQNLAKDRLEVSFELEADRMRNLSLPQDEFKKELAVVQEERRLRTDDDPKDLTFERFNAVAYAASPYRNPVIGWEGDLAALTVEDLRDWYRQWYAPNNATLVVVGDVDPEAVFDLARKHFGPLKAEPIAAAKPRPEPAQLGEQRIRVKAPAKEPYLIMGYKATGLSQQGGEDWEPYALEILSSILDGGASTRLQRELVRGTEVAADAGASYSAFTRLPGMVVIDGTPSKGHDIAELETALTAQVQRLKDEPVSAAELERIRIGLIANKVYELDSVSGQAMQLGMLETVGLGWPLVDQYVERLTQVTPAQIQSVANKYLTADNLTVAILDPQPMAEDAKATTKRAGAVPHVR